MNVMMGVQIGMILVIALFVVAVGTPQKGVVPARRRWTSGKRNLQACLLLAAILGTAASGVNVAAQEPPQTAPAPSAIPTQPSVLTNAEILQMVKAGFAEETILKSIRVIETRFDTSVAALIELKAEGVSEKVIQAMLSPKEKKEEAAAPAAKDPMVPDDVGVYYNHNGSLEEMHPEIVTWRTGGVTKALILGTKGHINGVVPRPQSALRVGTPLEFVIRCPESVDITEYLLMKLDAKPDRREFRALTGGFIHASSGLDKNKVPFTFKKIAPRTYRIRLTDLPKGEYGFLPPGGSYGAIGGGVSGAMIMQGAANSGKMFTFSVLE